ncbi:MarR family winged helix-turn-helix transcriptional regulator [Acidipropionibacterium acidipropionici]|uniref:MarR family winged helix-turn-helix transcriptional regulator n=1 Tax=Acidipropionibacterium acidipropionici TaxID=1748 RepID=UPI00110A4BC1|nr:MarR family transcriptional regulator [Acidipropionibacterium acidipropionici]QCV96078.1 MarR family transcriptional regulator [Acidipropionibacterium acidipropionici]
MDEESTRIGTVTDLVEQTEPLEQMVCFAMYSATQATVQYYRDVLAPFGITYQQFLVLVELNLAGRQSPTHLADALHLDCSSVSGLLNRMERSGLVERIRDDKDRRAVSVAATDRSREIFSRLGFLGGCVSGAMSLEPDEMRALLKALHKVRDAMVSAPRPQPEPVLVTA